VKLVGTNADTLLYLRDAGYYAN